MEKFIAYPDSMFERLFDKILVARKIKRYFTTTGLFKDSKIRKLRFLENSFYSFYAIKEPGKKEFLVRFDKGKRVAQKVLWKKNKKNEKKSQVFPKESR